MSEDRQAEDRLQRPFLIEVDEAQGHDPGLAPPPPDAEDALVGTSVALAARRASPLTRIAVWVFGALFTLILSTAAWQFVTGLLAANTMLGWVAFGLTGAALLVALLLTLREAMAFARQRRIDHLRTAAVCATSLAEAQAVLHGLDRIYAQRPDLAWARSRLSDRAPEVLDGETLLILAETELMPPLDAAALAEVEAAARQVATVTAFVPLALADVAAALYANLRLLRRLSEIYGGKSSGLTNLRLLMRVAGAVAGAGAVALADDLIGSVASGGVLGKLSRRFGEGLVNGALTVRFGIAAMAELRPLPFAALPRPGTSATVARALAGFLARKGADDAA